MLPDADVPGGLAIVNVGANVNNAPPPNDVNIVVAAAAWYNS